MNISLIATHRETGRVIHLGRMWVCDEYDSICFGIDEADCKEEYPHSAGSSFLPSTKVEDYDFQVVIGDGKQTEEE